MALPSHIAARRQRAAQALSLSCEQIAKNIGISPPDEVPHNIRFNRPMCEAVRLELLAEFMSRVSRAIGSRAAGGDGKHGKGSANGNNGRKLDQAEASG